MTDHLDGWSSSLVCGCLTSASGVGAISASQSLTWSARRSNKQGSAAGLSDHRDRADDECPSIQTLILRPASSTHAPYHCDVLRSGSRLVPEASRLLLAAQVGSDGPDALTEVMLGDLAKPEGLGEPRSAVS